MAEDSERMIMEDLARIEAAVSRARQVAELARKELGAGMGAGSRGLDRAGLRAVLGEQMGLVRRTLNKSLQEGLRDFIIEGDSFRSVLRQFAVGFLHSMVSRSLSMNPFARVTPFGRGGVVDRASFFGYGGGLGVVGEEGQEAILPLARGSDGRLGVRAAGMGGRSVSVRVDIRTPDVAGFRRSRSQTAALIRRAVLHGQRNQ